MLSKERSKRYIFDFYSITFDKLDLFSMSVESAFDKIIAEENLQSYTSYGCVREIFGLRYRSDTNSYTGQIRKFRKSDLPEVGSLGRDSKKIELELDEGVIEKNFFVYYRENSLLVMHRNDDGNTGSHLAQLLTASAGVAFYANPIIRPDQAEMLLNGKLNIKKFSVKIPKPTNPDLYPQNSISAKTLELLNQSGADYIDVTFTVDQKIETSAGRLTSALQSAIGSLLSMGAIKAKMDTDDNGKIFPIDLIANKIYSGQAIITNSYFPPNESMYKLADKAKEDQRESINDYFGRINRIN